MGWENYIRQLSVTIISAIPITRITSKICIIPITQVIKVRTVNPITCVILFLGCVNLSAAQTPSDSTWSFQTVLLDANEDDTLDYLGQYVKIGGIASSALGQQHTTRLATSIQNDNYGLPLFSKETGAPFEAGDSLVVEGRLHNYYGVNEIYVQSYEVFPEGNRTLSPKPFSEVASDPERYVGMLVTGSGEIVEKGSAGNGEYIAISTDFPSGFTPRIYISNFHESFKEFNFDILSVGDEVTVSGILSEHETYSPYDHNYLLYLNTPDDLHYAGLPQYYRYLLATIAIALGAVVVGWIVVLRRRVNNKTKQIQASLEEKDVLLREIHHRVKNNLSIISGLLSLQIDTTATETTQKALQDSQSRIHSMALIHDKLYQTETLSNIRLDEYLKELVEAIHNTFTEYLEAVTLRFELDPAEIDIDKVVPCGLLVNELVVNAFKHAFQKNDGGVLEIILRNRDQVVTLTVADNGPGIPDHFENGDSDSLGSMLISTFASQLEADMTIDRDRDGAAFVFTFPLN